MMSRFATPPASLANQSGVGHGHVHSRQAVVIRESEVFRQCIVRVSDGIDYPYANMFEEIVLNYHSDSVQSFRNYKKMAERAMDQVSDKEFFAAIDDEANSIAVIVKHLAGNLISRWTDF